MNSKPPQDQDAALFEPRAGILVARNAVDHREDEYDSHAFDVILKMQRAHFWYRGRHRFLVHALRRELSRRQRKFRDLAAIDLGGGCGGWIRYLVEHGGQQFKELALGDSSLAALERAEGVQGSCSRFQIDLLDLGWERRWDIVFLLDVLEHIPDHEGAIKQIAHVLKPGGLAFITTPALKAFWSYNDEVVQHQRRYAKRDFIELVANTGLCVVRSRYFMFLLSPLVWLTRKMGPDASTLSEDQKRELIARTHRVPNRLVNGVLTGIFSMETPFGYGVPFPWGTSILSVLQKPE